MHGAILTLPNTPSWRGAQLKKQHRGNFTFTFNFLRTLPLKILNKNSKALHICNESNIRDFSELG
jgi:hypothetical protein